VSFVRDQPTGPTSVAVCGGTALGRAGIPFWSPMPACAPPVAFSPQHAAQVCIGTMANHTYVDNVLAEDDRMASLPEPSKSPFVAVGSRMWAIWQTVLRFRHGYHRQPTATSLIYALMDSALGTSSLSYDEAPVNYPKNMRCKSFVVDVRFVS